MLRRGEGAAHVRSELGEDLRSSGADLLGEAVLKVDGKGKAQVYDPHRTLAGTLTPALTWGLFGLLAGGWKGLVIWAVVGALCGGLWAYYTEHIATKSELTRIGAQLGPDASALLIFAEAADAERLLSATAPLEPATASVAAIADDLSVRVFAGAASPVESSSTTGNGASPLESSSVLSMLLLRYPGEHAAKTVLKATPKAGRDAPQVELVFESAKSGKRRVVSPTEGVAYMVKQGIIGWGVFGAAVGAITGFAGNGGVHVGRERRRCRCGLGDLRRVRRLALRPLGRARSVGPTVDRSWAADPAGQLGDPRLGRREPRYGTNPPHTVDARCGDAWRAVQPRRAGRDSGGLRTMTAQRAA